MSMSMSISKDVGNDNGLPTSATARYDSKNSSNGPPNPIKIANSNNNIGVGSDCSLYGIFDGHGGYRCSQYCKDHLLT